MTDSSDIPHNRRTQVAASFSSKLGDAFSSTKVVIPAVLQVMSAPTFMIGLIAPIRESFSMLPQVLIKGWIRGAEKPQKIYTLGGSIQGLSLLVMALSLFFLEGWTGGIAVLGCLLSFSLARSLCSLSSKTVLGLTIPKSRRGSLMGLSGTLAGAVGVALGLVLLLMDHNPGNEEASQAIQQSLSRHEWVLTALLLVAALAMAAAGALFSRVHLRNEDAATPRKESGTLDWRTLFQPLRTDANFRSFVLTRALMMVSALAMPMVVAQSLSASNQVVSTFACLIALEGFVSLLSSRVWGAWADRDSRRVLLITAVASATLCLFAALLIFTRSEAPTWQWLSLYALFALVHQGVRLGRKTYVVDVADDEDRTTYVAVSNTCIGVLLLLFGAASAAVAQVSVGWMFSLFGLCALAALASGWQLEPVDEARSTA